MLSVAPSFLPLIFYPTSRRAAYLTSSTSQRCVSDLLSSSIRPASAASTCRPPSAACLYLLLHVICLCLTLPLFTTVPASPFVLSLSLFRTDSVPCGFFCYFGLLSSPLHFYIVCCFSSSVPAHVNSSVFSGCPSFSPGRANATGPSRLSQAPGTTPDPNIAHCRYYLLDRIESF